MIQNRVVALSFRLASFLFIFFSLLDQLGIYDGKFTLTRFLYYTILSNVLALVLFAVLSVKTVQGLRKNGAWGSSSYVPRFEMVCVVDLLLTLLVYWVLLAPTTFTMGADTNLWVFGNLSVHLITPLLCLVDYILFSEANHLKYKDVYLVTIFPLLYVAFSYLVGGTGYVYRLSASDGLPEHVPYFFLDFTRKGAKVLLYIGGLVLVFLVISHVFYWLDKKVKKPVFFAK